MVQHNIKKCGNHLCYKTISSGQYKSYNKYCSPDCVQEVKLWKTMHMDRKISYFGVVNKILYPHKYLSVVLEIPA